MGLPTFSSLSRIFLGTVTIGIASAAGLLYVYQRALIYPSSFPDGSRTIVDTPDKYDLPFSEYRLNTPDGQKLHVYAILQAGVDGDKSDMSVAKERPTVLMLHANAGNMGHRLPLAVVFYRRMGCNVVMLSYRGYGLSTGEPSEMGLRIDAQTMLDWMRAHPVISQTSVVAYGQSVGGAVAIDLAARNPRSIRALIIENTFLSIPQLIPSVLPMLAPFTFLCRENWPSFQMIPKIPATMPVLFLSGADDEIVPPSHMKELDRLCVSERKEFHLFPGANHNETCIKPNYFDIIAAFLLKYVIDADDLRDASEKSPRTDPLEYSEDADDSDWVKMRASDADMEKSKTKL
ncbi:bem46 protein, variant [Malassezia sp. CBS 17886]|nr:bem46 protein, variant [Malassezia sp. CBS 17886]